MLAYITGAETQGSDKRPRWLESKRTAGSDPDNSEQSHKVCILLAGRSL